jgi:hypothetical protein
MTRSSIGRVFRRRRTPAETEAAFDKAMAGAAPVIAGMSDSEALPFLLRYVNEGMPKKLKAEMVLGVTDASGDAIRERLESKTTRTPILLTTG